MATLCHVAAGRILAALVDHVPPYRAEAGDRTALGHVPPYHAAAGDRTGAGRAWGEAAGAVGIAVAAADTVAAEGDRISAAEALQCAERALGLVFDQAQQIWGEHLGRRAGCTPFLRLYQRSFRRCVCDVAAGYCIDTEKQRGNFWCAQSMRFVLRRRSRSFFYQDKTDVERAVA